MLSLPSDQDQHLEETAGLKVLATSTVRDPGSTFGSDHLGLLVGLSQTSDQFSNNIVKKMKFSTKARRLIILQSQTHTFSM